MSEIQTKDKHGFFKQNINYYQCKKDFLHNRENLDYICIDQKCQQKGLVCCMCIDENHQQHQTLSLKSFLSTIYDIVSIQGVQEVMKIEDVQQEIDQYYQSVLYTLKSVVQNFSEYIRKLEENLIQKYNDTKLNLSIQQQKGYDFQGIIQQIRDGSIQKDEDLQKLINFLIKSTQFDQIRNKLKVVQDPTKSILDRFNASIESINQELSTLNNNVEDVFKKMDEQLQNYQQDDHQLTFSQIFKGQQIQLEQENQLAVFKGNPNSSDKSSGIIIVDKPISLIQETYIGLKFQNINMSTQEGGSQNYQDQKDIQKEQLQYPSFNKKENSNFQKNNSSKRIIDHATYKNQELTSSEGDSDHDNQDEKELDQLINEKIDKQNQNQANDQKYEKKIRKLSQTFMETWQDQSQNTQQKKQYRIKCQINNYQLVKNMLLYGHYEYELVTSITKVYGNDQQNSNYKNKIKKQAQNSEQHKILNNGKNQAKNQINPQKTSSSNSKTSNGQKSQMFKSETWETKAVRRFREFDALYLYLTSKFSQDLILYQLPSKYHYCQIIPNQQSEQQFLRDRIQGLVFFINENGNNAIIQNDPIFQSFINFKNEEKQLSCEDFLETVQKELAKDDNLMINGLNRFGNKLGKMINDKFNFIYSLGFVQYMDDYDTVLEIKHLNCYKNIKSYKETIEAYLVQINKLDQNIIRRINDSQDIQKISEKNKKDGLIKDLNNYDYYESKFKIQKNTVSQIFNGYPIYQQDLLDKLSKKILKCKGTLQSALQAYNNHLNYIEDLGNVYKQKLDTFNKDQNKKIQEQQQQQQQKNNNNSEEQQQSIKKSNQIQPEDQTLFQQLEWEDMQKYVEILEEGKSKIEQKTKQFLQQLNKEFFNQELKKKIKKIYKTYLELQVNLADIQQKQVQDLPGCGDSLEYDEDNFSNSNLKSKIYDK
ncbi:Phox homologous domain [Pseudocohnilembus persalinus]|uniref:Phox homologous domain n=1 Tax=Pseudocohnilembus persalinus TaxID=266149 RepID=A0A0V0QKG1_PSEPJ|nr:Phox homologous domain [Pseudocohnilembus persalinus]|eukprot:KRX02676.1 Phox homologous domain [Pseudocohnilembus persalinus]